MVKSYWMKPPEEGYGNYSNDGNDTFDSEKKYVGVRLLQGPLPLDRDWNELEDIRRYEELMLRKWYIGNGTPDDGFKITPAGTSNDFNISPGRCLVDGFEAVNESQMLYSKQKDVPALTVPSGKRSDTVYMDLWIREISGSEDHMLLNPQDLGRETCRRHKVEWRCKVDESRGAVNAGHSPKEEFHHYYDIARIEHDGNQSSIIDLRRTDLALFNLSDSLNNLKLSLKALGPLRDGIVADLYHKHSMLSVESRPGNKVSELYIDDYSGDIVVMPNRFLHVTGNIKGSGNLSIQGAVDISGNCNRCSDIRLKTNVIPLVNVLDKLREIRGVSFEWAPSHRPSDSSSSNRDIGLIAQEVREVFPELVIKAGNEGYLGIDYDKMIGVLVEAIKELEAKNESLQRKMENIENVAMNNGMR